MELNLKSGNVYWANLDPNRGSEIPKAKLCVLVGATPINQARRTVVIVPISIKGKPNPPVAVLVNCFGKEAIAVCDQIRAVDKARLVKQAGSLSKKDMDTLVEGLKRVLSLG